MVTESVRDQVSPEEWALRVDLAACYRLVALNGWDDLVFTHISARVPGGQGHFLLNPFGMTFEELTASSLVKIDADCRKILPSPYEVIPAGFVIHSAIHAARSDAHCVLHTHTLAGVAVSALEAGLLPISQQATIVLPSLGYHDYEGLALTDDEKPRLVADLGAGSYLILRNHGLLTVGSSVANAFLAMYLLQRACEIQIRAAAAGALREVDAGINSRPGVNASAAMRGQDGMLAWPALLRRLDRIDPSYRT
ncbi:MAG TPA: class II aldolase/adducin family protein [Kofleriaceae bacterium]|nr:class II aldolase/adducin family protein [Kofleriaceae bacterium]